MKIKLDLKENKDLYSIYDTLTSNIGKPFDIEWPRGNTENIFQKRAEILMLAGIESLKKQEHKKLYKIVSFDGGGVRGYLSSKILDKILLNNQNAIEKTDMLAGTSTGAIIAALLAVGINAKEISKMYEENMKDIFSDTLLDDINDLGVLRGADYTQEKLEKMLKQKIGSMTLGELKKKLVIVTFELDSNKELNRSWKAKVIHNCRPGFDESNMSVVDALLCSSAAPIYFPIHVNDQNIPCIDGGVAANNPCVCALAQCLDKRSLNIELSNISMLSIGSGKNPQYISGGGDWGLLQWAKPLLQILLDANEDLCAFQAQQILNTRFARVQSSLPKKINLDNSSDEAMNLLKELANNTDITEAIELLKLW